MKAPNLSRIISLVKTTTIKRSPEILMGMGIAGTGIAVILAVKETPKALKSIDKKKDELGRKPTAGETVKVTWKYYIPAVATWTLSTACLIGARHVNSRRYAALAAAYTLSESALKEYQDKVVETIGEKKEQVIKDSIAKDKITEKPVREQEVILTERGNTLCFDIISKQYFKSDINEINKAINELNARMRDDMYVSLNEYYYEIGLPGLGLGVGDELGWSINDCGYIQPGFSSQLTEDGTPCLVIGFQVAPKHNYRM